MREITSLKITETVADLCKKAAVELPSDVFDAINHALANEKSTLGREMLREILQNAEIAKREQLPICQDTGMVVVFVEMGQEVVITGDSLESAINQGVAFAYKWLRKSIVSHPFTRENTGNNTPANIHIESVLGDALKIKILLKGGGAENASVLKMFLPTAGKEEIADFIVNTVKEVGVKACPPIIVGVGIGGAFDSVAVLAKKALLRPIASHSTKRDIAEFEKSLLKMINDTGVGPMGVGGNQTALAVHVNIAPCHIASLPVAINFDCHAHRAAEALL